MFDVIEDDLSSEKSRDLIAFLRAGMSESGPDDAEFLGLCDLQQPEVTVWSAWQNSKIASIGALKMLPDGPQKSSRCDAPWFRGSWRWWDLRWNTHSGGDA
jgi:hypothetical protein